MDKQKIISFFDNCAPWWDADMVRHEDVIRTILDNADIVPGIDVLDVACGTGVLFPDYLKREVASVTGIDISPQMVKIAQEKYPQIPVICDDVEIHPFSRQFDVVMVYNAFPHFPNPESLISVLARLVKKGGRVSICHGMSRKALAVHHQRAKEVSVELLEENALSNLMSTFFDVDIMIANDCMYQVCGIRR